MEISKQPYFSLILAATGIFLFVIDLFIVNIALPKIQEGLQASHSSLQWIIAMYVLGYAVFLITGGKIGSYYGKKKVYLMSMFFFVLSSCICGFAEHIYVMNVGRLLQGVSAAFMVPQGLALIPDLFPDTTLRARALAIYGGIDGLASLIGQFLGGVLPEISFLGVEGWRLIFLINIPFGLFSILFSYRSLLPGSRSADKRIDGSGILLFSAILLTLMFSLIQGTEWGWPMICIMTLLFSLLLLVLFLRQQSRKKARLEAVLIDVSLMKNKQYLYAVLASLFYYMVQDSYFLINSFHLQDQLGVSSFQTGTYFACQGFGYVIASLIGVRFSKVMGKKMVLAGLGMMIVGLIGHIWFLGNEIKASNVIYALLFFYGMGCGTALPGLLNLALQHISTQDIGAASGIYLTVQQVGIAIGVAIIGGVFFYSGGVEDALRFGDVSGYVIASALSILILGVVLLLLIPLGRHVE